MNKAIIAVLILGLLIISGTALEAQSKKIKKDAPSAAETQKETKVYHGLNPDSTLVDSEITRLMEYLRVSMSPVEHKRRVLSQLIERFPKVPAQFWAKYDIEFDIEEVERQRVQVMRKYFTDAELKQLVAFYDTPLGQKINKTMENVFKELAEREINWDKDFQMKILMKIKEAGYDTGME
ncbi:MAG: uncharacterized protein QG635_1647 [Bacteroidota bacterium]|nr:uncharacterized protein [Bacteroidota bacterium]